MIGAGEVAIVPTTEAWHIAGYNRCLDVVARERRYFGLVEGPPLDTSAAVVHAMIAAGGVHLVAIAGEEVVGWVDIARFEREGFRHGGRLGIGILREHRGRGLGERLMRAALDLARAKVFERVELEVYASNVRAAALYERVGFAHEGLKRRSRKLDGEYDDAIIMGLLFEEEGT